MSNINPYKSSNQDNRRKELTKALVVNAATKPVNLLLPSTSVALGIFIGAPIIVMLVLGLILWAGASLFTFFDAEEAEDLGQALKAKPPIALSEKNMLFHPLVKKQYALIKNEFDKLQNTISQSDHLLEGLEEEAQGLLEMAFLASKRANVLYQLVEDSNLVQIQRRMETLQKEASLGENSKQLLEALQSQETNLTKANMQIKEFQLQMERLAVEIASIRSSVATSTSVDDTILDERLSDETKIIRQRVNLLTNNLDTTMYLG